MWLHSCTLCMYLHICRERYDRLNWNWRSPSIHQIQKLIFLGSNSIEFEHNCVNPPIFGELVFSRCFAAFSARLQTLGSQLKYLSFQNSAPRNRGKMASEGRNRNFRWRAVASGLKLLRRRAHNQNLNLNFLPRGSWYRQIWVARFGGF